MFIHYCLKNNNYVISKRNFLCDYSRIKSKKIDMTMSGVYLLNNRKITFNKELLDKYPSIDDIELLENYIKDKYNLTNEVVIGNGVNGLLQNIIKILFTKKGNLVTPFYTFNQAEFGVTSCGSVTKRVYCNNYLVDLKKIEKSIDKKTRMVYICNPNNPTGLCINSSDIIDFAEKVKVPVIIDESGIEFNNQKSLLKYSDLPENLIVLRSFSKAYGIANLRIGYMVCNAHFKEIYQENISLNDFSGLSCQIAMDLIKDSNNYLKENVEKVLNERNKIVSSLEKYGIEFLNSDSNILMTINTFDEEFMKKIEKSGISVVPVYDENEKIHFRIAVQNRETNDKFIDALIKIIKNENM